MKSVPLLMLIIAMMGCIAGPETEAPRPAGPEGEPVPPEDGAGGPATEAAQPGSVGGEAEEVGSPAPALEPEVLLLGRSVANGWAAYMGLEWQEDGSYRGAYEGRSIRYRELDYPPDIDDSAIRAVDEYDPDIVFFKLCFVDFGNEYGDMLAEDKGYVENVYQEVVVERGKKLVVGNALPQVEMLGSEGLRKNHNEYNSWLEGFAKTHEGMIVLDLHGMLSDSGGNLKAGYAVSDDDSHLNDAAYADITPALMDAIERSG